MAEEVEVGLVLQEAATGDGTASAQCRIESEAVIGAVADVERCLWFVIGNPRGFLIRRHAVLPLIACEVQLRSDGGDFGLAVATEDADAQAACLQRIDLGE